jgi:WD40 repeat protein/transcriptional regulator with XRE-family HTH domain
MSFAGLLRQLRAEALLTQEELAEAARLSPRSVSDLERGISRTARKDTAVLLAGALGLAEPARGLFVAAALGRVPAADVLAARDGGAPAARWERECPYRGLLPFGESDAEVFYGRERLAADLAVKLACRAAGGGLVVVTGASGSGKSSLLRAGLLPILARGLQVPGSEGWPRIVMTPTQDPLTELAARLAAVGGLDPLAVREGLARHPDQAHLAVRSAVLAAADRRQERPMAGDGAARPVAGDGAARPVAGDGAARPVAGDGAARPVAGDGATRLVLIVDQFEQVFTLTPDLGGEAARQAFITALCSAAEHRAGPGRVPPALVVIAVRGDFWDRCAAVPELVGALQDGQFVVGPMTESELRVAITGPAEAAGLRLDPGLTDTILGDLRVAGGDRPAGVLPLLSQAMALTWEQREDDRLTSHGYAQAGAVGHAVQTGADRVYGALPPGQQAIAREVLRSMTVASRDGTLARRPVTRQDLYAGLPGAPRGDVDAVLEAFAAERLAVLDEDRAQLSHDVLLRAWPRLRGWLEEDQASWIVHGQLADAAAAWHDSREDPSFLYRGAQLAAVRQAVARWSASPGRYPALTGTQRGFLQASEQASARSSRRRRTGFAVLALLTVLAVVAAGLAFYQRAAAVGQRDQAVYNQVVAEALQFGTSDTTLAAQLTLAAYRLQPTQDLVSRLWNTENTPLSAPLAAGARNVKSVAFSPDGHMLASASIDGSVRLWDVADPAHPGPLGQPLNGGTPALGYLGTAAAADSVAFSPHGHTLATGKAGGSVQLWDVADPTHPRPLGQPQNVVPSVHSVAFSPDGHTLATGNDDGTVRLWDVTDPAYPGSLGQPLTGGTAAVVSVAFSPDGRILARGSADGTVRLWDVTDPAHPRLLGQPQAGGTAAADSVAFSPDGHTLATGNADGSVRLWDVADAAHPRPLGQPQTGTAAIDSVAFSPDGYTLASGSNDGTIRLWDIADPAYPRPLGQPQTGTAAADSVAFSPDGHTLASGNADGTIRLWSLAQTVLTGGRAAADSVAFSPGGHTLATGNADGTIRLWDIADPAHPRLLGQPLTGTTSVVSVAFSPDGHTLASGNADGTVQLWDVTDPAYPRPLGQPLTGGTAAADSVAFSPGGHTLASGNADDTIQLWDIADPARPRPLSPILPVDSVAVDSVAFSPGGHTLASANADGSVQLWDIADPARPRQLSPILTVDSVAVDSVAFSPGGHTLASANADGSVRLWDIADPARPRLLGQPLTGAAAADSVAFSPDGHTLASGNADGTVRLWDITDPAHPRPLGQPQTGTAAVDSVAFSPDGHTLASGNADGTVRLWNLNVQYAIQRICATAGGLTPRQWSQYIPQRRYQPSCGH